MENEPTTATGSKSQVIDHGTYQILHRKRQMDSTGISQESIRNNIQVSTKIIYQC